MGDTLRSPLGTLPEGWDDLPLTHAVDVIDCKHFTPAYHDFGIPIVRPRNVKVGGLDFSSIDFVNDSDFALLTDKRVPQVGDIVFSRNASFGIPALVRHATKFCIGQDVVIMVERGALSHFVFWSLLSNAVVSQIDRNSGGSTFGRINLSAIRALRLGCPPLPEQRRIAEILDTLDEAIRKTEQVIAKLQQMKQGLLHDLLTCGINEHGELRDPQRHPDQFKDSELGRIPKEWEVRSLEEWVHPQSQITYGIVQAGPHLPGGVPYIRTGDMKWKRLSRKGLLCTSRRIANSYLRSEVRTGDLVYAIRATVGKVLPVPPELDGANLTQGTARIAPGPEVNGAFLLWALRSQSAIRQVEAVQKGTTFSEITLAQLRLLLVPCPSELGEQQEIAARLNALENSINEEDRELAKLRTLKQGLMDDLLTGRVRVNVEETAQ